MNARATRKCTVRLPGKLVRDANELIRRFGPTFSPADGRFLARPVRQFNSSGGTGRSRSRIAKFFLSSQFLIEQLRQDPDRRSHTLVNFNLDVDVAQRLEEIKTQRISLAILSSAPCSNLLLSGLRKISDVAADPINRDWTHSCELRSLFVAVDEIAERKSVIGVVERRQEGLVEEGIAEFKNVPLASASKAYWSLTLERRRQLRSRSDVHTIVRL